MKEKDLKIKKSSNPNLELKLNDNNTYLRSLVIGYAISKVAPFTLLIKGFFEDKLLLARFLLTYISQTAIILINVNSTM